MTKPVLTKQSVPYFPKGVRVKYDAARGRTILMAPERTLALDEIGIAIVERVDGKNSLLSIVEELSEKYDAPVQTIGNDVADFLKDLIHRGYVRVDDDGS